MKKSLFVLVALTLLAFPIVSCAGEFGAIAYSWSTGNWGKSWNYNTSQEAIDAAMEKCNAGDCKWQVWLQNCCGAFARGTDGAWGRSWGYQTLYGAKSRALDECNKYSSGECRIICSVCTGSAR